MKRYWFKAKTYGWGWTPATWEGWLCTLGYLTLFFGIFVYLDRTSSTVSDTTMTFIPVAIVLTVMLIIVCWKTGEKPEWRWGN